MRYDGMMAMAMATAMMTRISQRRAEDGSTKLEAEEPATTATISPEEEAEMKRSPRAYRRRKMREYRKGKP